MKYLLGLFIIFNIVAVSFGIGWEWGIINLLSWLVILKLTVWKSKPVLIEQPKPEPIMVLKVSKTSEECIVEAIEDAMRANKEIVSLGLPLEVQKELLVGIRKYAGLKNIKELKNLYGYKVETTDRMQITTVITRFEPLKV